jgi:hypothetical protein
MFLRGAPAIAFDVHLEDRRMVNEAIDRRERHRRIDEHLAPLRERRVGGDGDAFAFVPFGDQLKEYRCFGLIAPYVTEIVKNQEVETIEWA